MDAETRASEDSPRPENGAAGPPRSPAPPPAGVKADPGKRFLAAVIDIAIAFAVGWVPIVGGVVGVLYLLFRDGLDFDFMDRRSVGKKVMKLRAVRAGGSRTDLADSVKRNLPLVLGPLAQTFYFIPFLGLLVAVVGALAGLAVILLEIALMFGDEEGRRIGDRIAGTRVIDLDE